MAFQHNSGSLRLHQHLFKPLAQRFSEQLQNCSVATKCTKTFNIWKQPQHCISCSICFLSLAFSLLEISLPYSIIHPIPLMLCMFFSNSSFSWYVLLSLSLSKQRLSLLSVMRPSPQWWWDRRRVIKVVSHLVGKLTSIRTILPKKDIPHSVSYHLYLPLCISMTLIHHPLFFLTWSLTTALHLSSSLSCVLPFFLIFPYPLLVITLNLSSSALLFCDGSLSF